MKSIIITFDNGEIYEVPVEIVAKSRTNYYAEIDGFEEGSEDYKREYDYSISDSYELKDWITSNMNWSDLSHVAKRIDSENKKYDYENQFIKAHIQVI